MLLDSNIIIYATQPQHTAIRLFIAKEKVVVSALSKVETLGFHNLREAEKVLLERFF
jgi:toxin FitB